MTEKILRANAYGQIVEYHSFFHKRTTNHLENQFSSDMYKSKMNQELSLQGVDGWCENVVVIQHALSDDLYFSGYAAATEEGTFHIPIWMALSIIAAASAVIVALYGIQKLYDFFSGVVEKALPTDRYTTEEGESTTSFTEYVTLQRQYYWLVCPVCGMGFASKTEYPTWEQVPEEVHSAFEEHVANCQGIVRPEGFPWLVVAAIGGFAVTVIGLAWVGSQVLSKAPTVVVAK